VIRLLADENLDYDLVRGVLRRRPNLDLIRVQSVGLLEADDPTILEWAANEKRALLTHDVNTMTRYAFERIKREEPMAGVFAIHQDRLAPMTVFDDLLLLDECSETSEWSGQILYLPMK